MDNALDDVRKILTNRIAELDVSPTAVSRRATGKPDMLRKFLNDGIEPGAGRLRAVCNELGLEFYIGLPREGGQYIPPEPEILVSKAALFSAVHSAIDTALRDREVRAEVADKDKSDDPDPEIFKIERIVKDIQSEVKGRGDEASNDEILEEVIRRYKIGVS